MASENELNELIDAFVDYENISGVFFLDAMIDMLNNLELRIRFVGEVLNDYEFKDVERIKREITEKYRGGNDLTVAIIKILKEILYRGPASIGETVPPAVLLFI